MRTTLTSGAWVEHTPIQELKGKHKRTLERVGRPRAVLDASGEVDREATMSGLDILSWSAAKRDAVWAMVIAAWSYDLPVPAVGDDSQVSDAASFGELPLEDFDELEQLMEPFAEKLNRSPSPKGGTTSSSNGSSRESAAASPAA